MRRLLPVFLGLLLLIGNSAAALAASAQALAQRQAQGLIAFNPPERFLDGNFVGDEMNPNFIFGPVKAFAASRKCPTTWLIEKDEQNRLTGQGSTGAPQEYTVYLEEDCPDKVVYYAFIDQSGLTPQQWIDWREKFHGTSKTGPEFSEAKSKLDKACTAGCEVSAELRFIEKNGEPQSISPEKALLGELHFAPIYDLNRQQRIAH
jgi:hypothetical protein